MFATWNFGQVIVSSFLQYEKCVLWFLRLWFWFSLNQTCREDHELSRSLFPTAAKSLQSCLTLCDPIPGILQARTLEWVAFPSPMHKSGKWKWSCSVMYNSSRPRGLQPTRLLRPWDFPGKSTGVGCHCLLRDLYLGRCDFQPVFAIYCGKKIALTVKLV